MINQFLRNFAKAFELQDKSPQKPASEPFSGSLADNLAKIKMLYGPTVDLTVRQIKVGNKDAAVITMDGFINKQIVSESVIAPLLSVKAGITFDEIKTGVFASVELVEITELQKGLTMLMSGFVLLILDGEMRVLCCGMQGFLIRSVSEPINEVSLYGSRESFTEALHINMTMLRRRMKNSNMRFETLYIGSQSNTEVAVCYLEGSVSADMLNHVKDRLSQVDLQVLLESGYLEPYLQKNLPSMFSPVGRTERPDVVCSKLSEGRICVMVDGCCYQLIIPYLFNENFQNVDDYVNPPYYTFFIRAVRYISFLTAMLMPGIYVAMCSYNPELFPEMLLIKIVRSSTVTPLPIMSEALIVYVIFEVLREAGLRLPRPIGGTVSFVGALIIGDAAVSAGLVSAPLIIIVALTAISSFTIPHLYEPLCILRLMFLLLGGTLGMQGIFLGAAVVAANISAINALGIPYTAPISPFRFSAMRDLVLRMGWTTLAKGVNLVGNMPGKEKND